jgi:hypothetical protein
MNKIIPVILCFVLYACLANAQTCEQFVSRGNGKKFIYANFDSKGNRQGRLSYSASKKDASTLSYHGEVTGKDGKPAGTADFDVRCNGTVLKMDMKSFIPATATKQFENMQVQGDGKYLTYPLKLKAGDKLEDGNATLTVMNKGSKFADIQIALTNRVVEIAEKVQTPAGKFDCFKITYQSLFKAKVMGLEIPVNLKVIEWFSPKIGRFVKSEIYRKDSLSGSMILESIN